MKKKILIPYCMYGNGHRAIANYITEYFKEQDSELEILTIDLLKYSIPIIGTLSQKWCDYLMLKHPFIWSLVYDSFDTKITGAISNKISVQLFNNKRMKKIITDFSPDLTISTHFYGSSLIDMYNRKDFINSKLITVITDYEAHEMWLKGYKKEQAIVVGDKDEVKYLKKRGIDASKIKPFGIPISPKVELDFDKEKLLKKLKITGYRPICLFFGGGGNGSKASLPYIRKLIKMNLDIDILFVAGRNQASKAKVDKWVKEFNATNIHTFGFVNNVPELLQICDFVISKPGGAQTTESLYFKKPIIMINCSGGQERANYKYFEKNNYGKRFRTVFTFSKYIEEINRKPELLDEMKKNMLKSNSDKAMHKLYELALEILEK